MIHRFLIPAAAALILLASCGGGGPEVVVYVALDQHLSEPVLDAFEKRTGIAVKAVYDTEASKTVRFSKEYEEIHRAAAESASDSLSRNRVPKALEGMVKKYFDDISPEKLTEKKKP